MNNKIIAILWIGFSVQLGLSQTISGTITNPENQPIPQVNISVLNSTSGTISDAYGAYTLKLSKGHYTLQISTLGYASNIYMVELNEEDQQIDMVLQPSNTTIDEIVITAQKHEQNLRDVPVAVTNLGSKRLKETRTWSLKEAVGIVPNYTASELGVGFQQLQSIRGIQVFSENPAIATYIDGVNSLDIAAGGIQFSDVERIEVLRGPQGTLYGRNALGGVINIITKHPTNNKEGFYESSMGNLGLQRHALGYKSPLIEHKLFLGVNAQYQYTNGFLTNSTEDTADPQMGQDGRRVGDDSSLYGNVFLKWYPNEKWETVFNLKTQLDQSDASAFFVSMADDQIAKEYPNRISLGRVGEHQRNLLNASMAMYYKGYHYKISSISSYQRTAIRFDDIDFSSAFPNQIFASYNDGQQGVFNKPQEVFSQEFRMSSDHQNAKINYTSGAFYFNQTNYEPSTNTARATGERTLEVISSIGKNEGIAVFGEINYSLLKRFTATAGLRYEYENRKLINSQFTDDNGVILSVLPREEISGHYDALLPKLAVSYKIGEKQNLYLSYTKGFRAGGINATVLPADVSRTYEPEYSNNFELGYKSNLFSNRVQLNTALFYVDWTDIQFYNAFGNFVFARTNVGDARSMGVEAEVVGIPAKGLQIEANIGINDTEYKDFVLSRDVFNPTSGEVDTVLSDISGNKLSNAPEHTLFFATQYELPAFADYSILVRGAFKNIGRQFSDIQNDLEITSYSLLNAFVSISNGTYSLSTWVRNIGDERYIAYGAADTSFGRSTRMAQPRTYGATLNIKF